ncbi:hypothetical protein AAMO2058_001234000 [Amorphochlora amoebiformis]
MVVFPARSVAAWGFSFGIIIFFAYYSTAPLPLRRPVAQIVTRGSVAPRFSSPKRIFKPWFGKTRTCQRAISQNKDVIEVELPKFLDCEYPFILDTLTNRVPNKIIARTIEYNKDTLTDDQVKRLEQIAQEMKDNCEIRLIEDGALDAKEWNSLLTPYADANAKWSDLPWLVWETYLYRRMLEASDYWSSRYDLFALEKSEGLKTSHDQVQQRMQVSSKLGGQWTWESFRTVLLLDLWGNQADASLFSLDTIGSKGTQDNDNLISDDSPKVWQALTRSEKISGNRKVVFFNDNAGLEIVSDLSLAHFLLKSGQVQTVEFKVKPYPFFVSDATPKDVEETIEYLKTEAGEESRIVGEELSTFLAQGKLKLIQEEFLASGLAMWEMPEALREELKTTTDLVIVKGDLMYRKLLGNLNPIPNPNNQP